MGSVRLLTDGGGSIVESYTYDPFGLPSVMTAAGTDGNWLTEDGATANSSAYGNPYMFTARRWDADAGLYYYRFRDYAPELGRFVQTDPAGYIDTMNLYAYCANNPVNWIDPWGLCGKEDDSTSGIEHLVGPALIVAGQPIVNKRFVMEGASKGTSVASTVLRKAFPQKMGTRILGTRSLGGAMGRAVPIVGWVWLYCDIMYTYGVDPDGPPYEDWKQDYIDRNGVHYWPGGGL